MNRPPELVWSAPSTPSRSAGPPWLDPSANVTPRTRARKGSRKAPSRWRGATGDVSGRSGRWRPGGHADHDDRHVVHPILDRESVRHGGIQILRQLRRGPTVGEVGDQ